MVLGQNFWQHFVFRVILSKSQLIFIFSGRVVNYPKEHLLANVLAIAGASSPFYLVRVF